METPIAITIPFHSQSNIAVRGTQPYKEEDWTDFAGICISITEET